MAFLWLLSCFALIGVSFGDGASSGEPELSIVPRIINGKDALPGSWPWHVAIQSQSRLIFCGGTLLNRFWVMTAAHCNITLSDRVITGLFDRSSPLNKTQVLWIVKIFLHPKFNSDTFYGDIALLRLSTPAHLHDMVSPALLPSFAEAIPAWTRCIIMGWGYTHHKNNRDPLKLQQGTVAVISSTECKKHWGNSFSHAMICAGAKDVSNYDGDSGGPLMCPKDGFWKVVGIASHASTSYPTSKPVVFTRVAAFIPWIEHILAHN